MSGRCLPYVGTHLHAASLAATINSASSEQPLSGRTLPNMRYLSILWSQWREWHVIATYGLD